VHVAYSALAFVLGRSFEPEKYNGETPSCESKLFKDTYDILFWNYYLTGYTEVMRVVRPGSWQSLCAIRPISGLQAKFRRDMTVLSESQCVTTKAKGWKSVLLIDMGGGLELFTVRQTGKS